MNTIFLLCVDCSDYDYNYYNVIAAYITRDLAERDLKRAEKEFEEKKDLLEANREDSINAMNSNNFDITIYDQKEDEIVAGCIDPEGILANYRFTSDRIQYYILEVPYHAYACPIHNEQHKTPQTKEEVEGDPKIGS